MKTADEMLRNCGYKRAKPRDSYTTREYVKRVGSRDWYLRANNDGTISIGPEYEMIGINNETILACAQLIREMGCADA